eukprot:TRINITY_DN15862_c0_g2_i1.p1 TRINITY_DN15862_c0_g2~~TRINITY_DN15862_c0_g2_i1.p1  ORF type:complete len:248 (-),score=49.40 TRINITY_DN15862_c0_g2_i1:48-791(-)
MAGSRRLHCADAAAMGDPAKSDSAFQDTIRAEFRTFKSFAKPYGSSGSLKKGTAGSASMPEVRLGSAASLGATGTGGDSFSAAAATPPRQRVALWPGQTVQLLGMSHRQDLEGAHAEVLEASPDAYGRVRVQLRSPAAAVSPSSSTLGSQDQQEPKVMRVMVDRLLPKAPPGRPRPTEAVWMLGETVKVPVSGQQKQKPETIYLKQLERQAELTDRMRYSEPPAPHRRRAFIRKLNGGFYNPAAAEP